MKKSALKAYIREEIISTLQEEMSPAEANEKKTNIALAQEKIKDAQAKLQTNPPPLEKNAALASLKAAQEDLKQANAIKESEDDDSNAYDKEPTKADLKKEKIKGAPSKFEISKEDYEDFKTRLKNLVSKIKGMEKGETRDKKMAALKQFIKNPKLVKAFKERDVKIDTDGLIG